MPVGHFSTTESDVILQSAVAEIVSVGYQDKAIIGTVLNNYSDLVDANHRDVIIIPRIGNFDDLVEPTIAGCEITDPCQKLDLSGVELSPEYKAYLCWEFERAFARKNFPKEVVIEKALVAGYKKATVDLVAEITALIGGSNTFDGTVATGDLLDAVYQAEGHLVDAGLEHNQMNSFIIGTSAMIRRLRQLKAVTSCCGEFVNPINDIVGAVAGFTFIQVPASVLPANQGLVINKASGGWALFDSQYQQLAKDSLLCDKYAWLQEYGIELFGAEYVAAINY